MEFNLGNRGDLHLHKWLTMAGDLLMANFGLVVNDRYLLAPPFL